MGRMNKVNNTLKIVNDKKVTLGSTTIDISDMLSKVESKEYRRAELDNIVLNDIDNNKPVYLVKEYGSVEAVFDINLQKGKKAILNFASSYNPGGGFRKGCIAQEEILCYNSNIWQELERHEEYYRINRSNTKKYLFTDGVIYINNVTFFCKGFVPVKPMLCDVITCAAPNAGRARICGVSEKAITETITRRIEDILKVAIDNSVEILVLGAFGCGVYKNNPELVASKMKELLDTTYGKYFKYVVFPLVNKQDSNYPIFARYFKNS